MFTTCLKQPLTPLCGNFYMVLSELCTPPCQNFGGVSPGGVLGILGVIENAVAIVKLLGIGHLLKCSRGRMLAEFLGKMLAFLCPRV